MRNYIILGVCVAVVSVVLTLLFRPAPKPEIIGDLTPVQEKAIQADLVTEKARGDSLQKELDKSKSAGKVAEKAFKTEIQKPKKKIQVLKLDDSVIEIVNTNPKIDSLHRAYDEAMVAYEGRVFSLTNELQQRDELNLQIQKNFEKRLADTQSLLQDKEAEVVDLQKQNKKLRRKLTGTKIIGGLIILGIGALAL